MSQVFSGKFMEQFQRFMDDGGMDIDEELHRELYRNEWVVYAKRPLGGAAQVIEYLGRYTHKVAISNHRLVDIADGNVTFRYKDYRDDGKNKTMTLDLSNSYAVSACTFCRTVSAKSGTTAFSRRVIKENFASSRR